MLIYAHRGASADFPEQSRQAYLEAIKQGADGFECDLRLTKDQELICWHDADTLRMSGQKVKIADSTFEELSFAKPLLFTELFRIAYESGKNLALETKHPVKTGGAVERELLRLISDSHGITIDVMSFSNLAVRRIISAGFSGVNLAHNKLGLALANSPIIGPGLHLIKQDPKIVDRAHLAGKKVYVWTVNSDEDVKFCADLGVDAIMSDNPARARKALGYA
jgi:glycerophosphoryl diester phosphodiesterase